MSAFTKQSIIDCTVKLAETKAINRITIYDIVNACGITRNTFYYYFHDIYDVFDQAVEQEVNKFSDEPEGNLDQALFNLIDFCIMYKKVWKNLYKTMGHEKLSKYVIGRLHNIFTTFVRKQPNGDKLSERDMDIICTFYEEALFGVLAHWIRGDSKNEPEDMHEIADRIRVLFTGNLTLMITNATKDK